MSFGSSRSPRIQRETTVDDELVVDQFPDLCECCSRPGIEVTFELKSLVRPGEKLYVCTECIEPALALQDLKKRI